jgi:hypothetical protein
MATQTHPLIARLTELPNVGGFYEDSEPVPSRQVISTAEHILYGSVDTIDRYHCNEADIHPFDGSVLIVWNRGDRMLKLVVPATGEPFLYQREKGQSQLTRDVSKDNFDHLLAWFSGRAAKQAS